MFILFDGLNHHCGKDADVGILIKVVSSSDEVIGGLITETGVFFTIRSLPVHMINVSGAHRLFEATWGAFGHTFGRDFIGLRVVFNLGRPTFIKRTLHDPISPRVGKVM